ncbi:AraC family transcriptional regulator [Konateibacter massiliensis]|uniref:AraC family transcriptional regulator n=1 Tax=Konateibacter massiliensis TaxID=2002841 RepID=UPI000C14A788|nr:AraC family transcriptional regulator [Konateibacter massiliensis]
MNTFYESFPKSDITTSERVLHTPSVFAKSSLFYMQEAGTLKSLKSHLCQRENLNSFLFIIVLAGKGVITIKNKVYALNTLDCVLIDCKQSYSHQSSEEDPWELMWVHFNGENVQSYYNLFVEQAPSFIFHTDSPTGFTSAIHGIIEAHNENNTLTELIISKRITDILTLCFSESKKAEENNNSMAIKLGAIRNYIDDNFKDKISLDQLAEQFYISKFHLSREFKTQYGVTIGNYIQLQRINMAKKLLRFSDKSIESIACECGIPDMSYFNKVFKKSENLSASRYRKEWVNLKRVSQKS